MYAALTEKAIGISYGDSSTAGLAKMLQGSDAGSDTMLTAGIDVRRYNQLYKNFIQQTMASTAAEEDDPEAYQQAQSMQKLFEDSSIYTQQFGQSFNTLRITENGLTLDSSQELNLD